MDSQTNTLPVAIGVAGNAPCEHLYELERFAELGRLSVSLLHDISNPLNAAMLWLEQCGNQHSPHMSDVRSSIRLLHRYVEAARQQVRLENRCRTFDIAPELKDVRHILAPIAKHRRVRLRFTIAGRYSLYGDPVKFQQIVTNLLQNAIDAYDDCPVAAGPRIVSLDLRASEDFLVISVSDRGCGIADSQLERLFNPFYSTKNETGQGLGIGLFTVKRYIETDFQGSIQVRSCKRQGTCFIVRLRLRAA